MTGEDSDDRRSHHRADEHAAEPGPIDLLIAFEKAADTPIRAEYVEGTVIVPPQPDDHHNDAAAEFYFQLRPAGFPPAGLGSGYRVAGPEGTRPLIVPDFYVRRRKPTELDEAYRRAYRGWYSIELLSLAG